MPQDFLFYYLYQQAQVNTVGPSGIIIIIINYTYKAQISTKCSSALNTHYIKYGSNN